MTATNRPAPAAGLATVKNDLEFYLDLIREQKPLVRRMDKIGAHRFFEAFPKRVDRVQRSNGVLLIDGVP